MICQLFEVDIRDGLTDVYMDLAMSLRPALADNGGCVYIERFASLSRPRLLLSYQVWRDEGAMTAWRAQHHHHQVQAKGREQVFNDYRIRVGQLALELTGGAETARAAAPAAWNDPARRPSTWLVACNASAPAPPATSPTSPSRSASDPAVATNGHETFASKYQEGSYAHLFDTPDAEAASALARQLAQAPEVTTVRVIEVYRDYGMFDRAEAPQYFPEAARR